MKWMSRRELVCIIAVTLGVFLFGSGTSAGSRKYQTYRRPEIDMPVSLAVGTVRTPEFIAQNHYYLIIIQVEKRLPFSDMMCLLGLSDGPLDPYNCDKEPLLQADWTVLNDGHIIAKGSMDRSPEYLNHYILINVGGFKGESGKKYIVEVKFTKNGTSLNVTNPHLVIMMTKPTDW
ncbi:MAG TPA: hypothetical protein VGE85_09820 [Terracidiphilus sp.]|jgi:hypothetical protein